MACAVILHIVGDRTWNAEEVQAVIKDELERLMDKLEPGVKQDMKKIREEVFGPNVFWVTEMQSIADRPVDIAPGAWLVRAVGAFPLAHAGSVYWLRFACTTMYRAARQAPPGVKFKVPLQVRGNLRTGRDDAFQKILSGVENLYGDPQTCRLDQTNFGWPGCQLVSVCHDSCKLYPSHGPSIQEALYPADVVMHVRGYVAVLHC